MTWLAATVAGDAITMPLPSAAFVFSSFQETAEENKRAHVGSGKKGKNVVTSSAHILPFFLPQRYSNIRIRVDLSSVWKKIERSETSCRYVAFLLSFSFPFLFNVSARAEYT